MNLGVRAEIPFEVNITEIRAYVTKGLGDIVGLQEQHTAVAKARACPEHPHDASRGREEQALRSLWRLEVVRRKGM